jgi:hypothetical protein
MVRGCPVCGAQFEGVTYETVQDEAVEFHGGMIFEVLSVATITHNPESIVDALILAPCGCRVSVADWQLCQIPGNRWFARPDDVEGTIRREMAKLS